MRYQKVLSFSLLLAFSLTTAMKCRKEGPDCHYTMYFKNESPDTVLLAMMGYMDTLCTLSILDRIIPDSTIEFNLGSCWEDEFHSGKAPELYFVDPNHFNGPYDFYSCDSIFYKNTVLSHKILQLEELKRNGFVVTYP